MPSAFFFPPVISALEQTLLLLQLGNEQEVVFWRFPVGFAKVKFNSVLARKGPITKLALVGGPQVLLRGGCHQFF